MQDTRLQCTPVPLALFGGRKHTSMICEIHRDLSLGPCLSLTDDTFSIEAATLTLHEGLVILVLLCLPYSLHKLCYRRVPLLPVVTLIRYVLRSGNYHCS